MRGALESLSKSVHAQVVRNGDVYYARRQMELYRRRAGQVMCVVDPDKKCERARRCGIETKVEACKSFVMRKRMSATCNGVPTSCRHCSKENMVDCGWKCFFEVQPREVQA